MDYVNTNYLPGETRGPAKNKTETTPSELSRIRKIFDEQIAGLPGPPKKTPSTKSSPFNEKTIDFFF